VKGNVTIMAKKNADIEADGRGLPVRWRDFITASNLFKIK
jgi:hypothetical protein